MSRSSQTLALTILLALPLAACSGARSPMQPSLANLVITGGDSKLRGPGDTVELTLVATRASGAQEDQTAAASWSSSDAGVATVNSRGLVSAVAEGTAAISARYENTTISTSIVVEIPTPADPRVTATVIVEPSPEPDATWRAHLQVALIEQRGSSGFRVDLVQIDYRDFNNRSIVMRALVEEDFVLAWKSNRVDAGKTQRFGRMLDYTRTQSDITINIVAAVTDDLGNASRLTATVTGRAPSSLRPFTLSSAAGVPEAPPREVGR